MDINSEVQANLELVAKLPRAARMGILAGIVAILCGSYYFLVYATGHEDLQQMRARELELQRKLSEVRSVASNIDAFAEEIANLETKLEGILRQLPNKKQLEVLLTDISNLGKTAGIEIKSFRRQDEIVHDFYAEVPIALEIEGSFHDLARFFDMISRLPRIVNMGSLKIVVGRETLDGTRLRISGTATTFRFIEGSRA